MSFGLGLNLLSSLPVLGAAGSEEPVGGGVEAEVASADRLGPSRAESDLDVGKGVGALLLSRKGGVAVAWASGFGLTRLS